MKSSRILAAILLMVGSVAAQQDQTTTSRSSSTSATSTSQNTPSSTSSTTRVAITGGDSGPTQSGNLPAVTGGVAAPGVTDLPTLSRTPAAIPTYPAPAVPPTSDAPFMQRSTLPQGTVFIAVGAILGAFGLMVLIWRSVVAWMLHRDVERAAAAQHMANDKAATFPPPPAPFYKSYNDSGSNPNLLSGNGVGIPAAAASAASLGRGVRRTNRGPTPSATPSQSNLFFSPTAGPGLGQGAVAGGGMGGASGGNARDSRFLPSGFYAAGASQPSPVRHEHNISLSNLQPDSRGHARAAVSPPDSPSLGPGRHSPAAMPPQRNVSTSTLNLNSPPTGRAPSAYLEDMLDDPNSHLHHLPGGARPQSHYSASMQPGGRF